MRITGGAWRGRIIKTFPGLTVRPTQDRVREALFSMLGDTLPGAVFVDLFAGTGVVGLEALSRGAARVVWVERDRRVVECLRKNVDALAKPERANGTAVLEPLDVERWIRQAVGFGADIVFADPPYAQETHWMDPLLRSGILKPSGWLVLERPTEKPAENLPGWCCERDRAYGRTRLRLLTPLPERNTTPLPSES